MIAEIISIDFGYNALNPGQIWAQAVDMYRKGYDWQLSHNDRLLQGAINLEYTVSNPLTAEVVALFDVDPNNKESDFMSTRDLMLAIGQSPLNIPVAMKLGAALKADLKLTKGKIRNKEDEERAKIMGLPRPQPLPGYFGLKRKIL
jgi:predicted P-loop ATPase